MEQLDTEEGRLIAVRRAIQKFGQPHIINTAEASMVTAYVTNMLDLDIIESAADEDNLEYWLDGLVTGLAVTRLVDAEVPLDDLPKPKKEREKQFQTGVNAETGAVNVRT